MMLPVVLASASPRRRELLTLVGIAHQVHPADVDERVHTGEAPAHYVDRLAREKAAVIAAQQPAALVIAADTTVVLDGAILGKPESVEEAESMLRALSGRSHVVYTGIAVHRGARIVSGVDHVLVTMRALTDDEIRAYVATGEPMDKAGAYGIQGYGATIVTRIEGDFFAVMGLGLATLVRLLDGVGARYDVRAGVSARD
jgi:septum formation protein